ncbi:MAG: imidazole glycerol phosphate synthase subunit HisH [Halomonadaceae bacterium]|nr:MAG: imidazole glycerol phosphate synthase subunit HisH [Halomonadaceae bacterium]
MSSTAKQTLAIIDYGMGNLHSVAKAIEHVAPEVRVLVTDQQQVVRDADRVILPGVGAMRDCMAEIRRLGVDDWVREAVAEKPLLGICVGMQALMDHSEENDGVDGIKLLPSVVRRFAGDLKGEQGERLKVPHMGWNEVFKTQDHPLWHGITPGERFYFVHSYYVEAQGNGDMAGRCHYGVELAAAVARDNLFAVQFHPEKSHHAGLKLLKNFTRWQGA